MKVITSFFAIILLLALLSESLIHFTEAVKLRNPDSNKADGKKKKKKISNTGGSSVESTPPVEHEEPPKKKPAAPKKKGPSSTTQQTGAPSKHKPGKPKYVELVDLALDHAKQYCTTLGPLIERPRFSYKRRCDVYYEAVEMFITGFSDTMINEFDLTQQEMVNRAQKSIKLMELKGALKAVARRALESLKTDEKKLQTHLNGRLSQWIMNLAIGTDGSGGGGSMGGLSMGPGGVDARITDEDRIWAEEVSADDYEDDPEKDDPEYIHKQKSGGKEQQGILDAQGNPLPQDKVNKMFKGMNEEAARRKAMDTEESDDM